MAAPAKSLPAGLYAAPKQACVRFGFGVWDAPRLGGGLWNGTTIVGTRQDQMWPDAFF